MKHTACNQLSIAELMEYWLDELSDARVAATEEHLFNCAGCHAQLENIASIGMATRELVQQGKIAAILTPGALDTLKATGLRIREYHLDPGGSVNCTIAPDDDLAVSHLRAPLAGVRRLDLVFDDVDTAFRLRLTDIGFDPTNNEVVVMPKAEMLRSLYTASQRMRLFAIDATGEHLLGEYMFNHTRHPDLQ